MAALPAAVASALATGARIFGTFKIQVSKGRPDRKVDDRNAIRTSPK